MAGSSLMSRLRRAADPLSNERAFVRGEDLESAVAEHLRQMLNTRAGSALTAPDYGVIEFSELLNDFPDAIGVMQRAIKNSILKYEPRLKNVQVRPVEQDDEQAQRLITFEITGQLVYSNGDRQPIRFSTQIDESSNVSLKS
jgi:type VI secretion system protein